LIGIHIFRGRERQDFVLAKSIHSASRAEPEIAFSILEDRIHETGHRAAFSQVGPMLATAALALLGPGASIDARLFGRSVFVVSRGKTSADRIER
jgi:hypothetical protein